MTLCGTLPNSVVCNGRKVKIDLDFRNVLRMIETLSDTSLMPEVREYKALKFICRHPKKGMLPVVCALLFKGEPKDAPKVTDFKQDAELIQSAFMQAYGINLFREKLHWFEFTAFLAGLPEGSRYTEVINIRTRPMPAPTKYNQAERTWLARAKSEFAVHMSEGEQKANYERQVQDVGRALLAFFGEGGGE